MNNDPRHLLTDQAKNDRDWDILVIGGGATGLSTAWDAASRGFKVALVEKNDFTTATSSRSTKLAHGGVRYLQNGEIGLVREALQERSLLLKNAPEFCQTQRFIMPTHTPLARYYYRCGMWLYDRLAGSSDIPPAELLSPKDLLQQLPNYHKEKSTGGIAYTDAQFDDSALAIALAQCINASGSLAINYVGADQLLMNNGKVCGFLATDQESGESWEMRSKVVINATGIFSDIFRKSSDSSIKWNIRTSRGSHIVVPGKPLGSDNALIIPDTSDGRVLFAIPWKDHTLIGTTDVPTEQPELHPTPSDQEIHFLIQEAQSRFSFYPTDITSSWSGLRPLVSRAKKGNTAALSRKHIIDISSNGLISILGGKWTTARKMAEDTIDSAIKTHSLPPKSCQTKHLKLCEHGATQPLTALREAPAATLTPEVINKCYRDLYARNADDILARRTRMSMLDNSIAQSQAATIQESLPTLKTSGDQ